ncbi:MAG: EamA family transporter [Candidatus Limnocylindria bacterium]
MPPAWRVWLALGTVYVIWGSTYLAIRVVVDTLPPFLSAGVRFIVAGAVLAVWLLARDGPARLRVSGAELRSAGIVGVALLLFGNGFVQMGERDVPSGLTALLIGSVPLWVVVYRRLAGERIGGMTLGGVLLGFAGVGFLALPRGISGEVAPVGLVFILVAAACWAWGTFISKRVVLPRDPLVSTTLQQLLGGLGLVAAAVLTGEVFRLDPAAWSVGSLVALGYLVVFGSLVAFSAYTWLLVHVPVSTVATYAYVNPVVAVLLGAAVLAEPVTATIVAGAAMVITAVAFIVRKQAPTPAEQVIEPAAAAPR